MHGECDFLISTSLDQSKKKGSTFHCSKVHFFLKKLIRDAWVLGFAACARIFLFSSVISLGLLCTGLVSFVGFFVVSSGSLSSDADSDS